MDWIISYVPECYWKLSLDVRALMTVLESLIELQVSLVEVVFLTGVYETLY